MFSSDHRGHVYRAWGVMYRQAYPWQAARQQHADGHLVSEGEGLAFVCFSCSISGALHCSTRVTLSLIFESLDITLTRIPLAFAEIEGAIDRMCGVGQVTRHSVTAVQLPLISLHL